MGSEHMSAAREQVVASLSDQAWRQLLSLEAHHREIQLNHARVIRKLDEASMATDRKELLIAWNQYRAVVADLSHVTEEIGSLRLTT
jgi:hypothetical protein